MLRHRLKTDRERATYDLIAYIIHEVTDAVRQGSVELAAEHLVHAGVRIRDLQNRIPYLPPNARRVRHRSRADFLRRAGYEHK